MRSLLNRFLRHVKDCPRCRRVLLGAPLFWRLALLVGPHAPSAPTAR